METCCAVLPFSLDRCSLQKQMYEVMRGFALLATFGSIVWSLCLALPRELLVFAIICATPSALSWMQHRGKKWHAICNAANEPFNICNVVFAVPGHGTIYRSWPHTSYGLFSCKLSDFHAFRDVASCIWRLSPAFAGPSGYLPVFYVQIVRTGLEELYIT